MRTILVLMSLLPTIVLTGCSSWWCSSGFQIYDLGNGVKILALENPNDAYPLYASTFKAEMDLALSSKDDLSKVSLGGKYESQVKELYETLDKINADQRNGILAIYSKFITAMSVSTSPEERAKVSDAFDKALLRITELAGEIRKLNIQIAYVKTATSSTEWEKLFKQGNITKEKAKKEI